MAFVLKRKYVLISPNFSKRLVLLQTPWPRSNIGTFENRTQSSSIELNPWIEFDWVRQSNEIEHQTFMISESDFRTNRIQSNSIHLIVCSIEFGNRNQSNYLVKLHRLYKASPKQAHQSKKPILSFFYNLFNKRNSSYKLYTAIKRTERNRTEQHRTEQSRTKLSLFSRAYSAIVVLHTASLNAGIFDFL